VGGEDEEDELKPPGTFSFSSTSPLSGHDVSDDRHRNQAIQDLIYLICRHTYMIGVLFNTVDYRRLLNPTELVIVISSFSVNKSLGPLISKNAKKDGWVENQSCFAMSMNSALLYGLDDDKRTLINIDLFEKSHEANAFDNGIPHSLVSNAAAFARQILKLANDSNVTLIGQGKHVNDILKAAIEENHLQSTTNFFGLSHPTNGSANAFGNHRALSFAECMNQIFHKYRNKVNWVGLILQRGLRSDKHNGTGGVIGAVIGDRSSELITKIPTAKPHINVVAHCNALGIINDPDNRLQSMISHLREPLTRTALYLSMIGTEAGINSHRTDPNCQPGEHRMSNGEMSMSDRDRGIASHRTDPNCQPGEHRMSNGEMSTSTLARVTKAGKARLGCQNIDNPIMLLELVSSIVDPDATLVKKFTQNQADIVDVLLANEFFKKITSSNPRDRIRKYKDIANNSDDKSHTFTTQPRSDNARRATDLWKLSLHESEDSVKAFAPEATRVTTDDRAVSESSREVRTKKRKQKQQKR
jgi:hypothetical protein